LNIVIVLPDHPLLFWRAVFGDIFIEATATIFSDFDPSDAKPGIPKFLN